MRISLTVIFLIATLSAYAQDNGEEARPIKLTAASSKVLDVPRSYISSRPQCDAEGNLYSHVSRIARVGAISKIAMEGPSAQYAINADDVKHLYFLAFHVTTDKRIWFLTGGQKDAISLFRIDPDDASKSERINLDAPDGLTALTVQSFVMLPKDHILLQGYFDDQAPKEKQGHSYLAEFDSSGKLLRTTLEKATAEAVEYASKWGAQTAAYQSGDGTTYLLQQDKILLLSEAGDVMRTIPLAPAQKGYQADFFYMNKGRLIVSFYGPDPQPNKPLTTRYALVDPSSGEVIRWYESDEELGTFLVCFSDEGLIFTRPAGAHVKLVTATIK